MPIKYDRNTARYVDPKNGVSVGPWGWADDGGTSFSLVDPSSTATSEWGHDFRFSAFPIYDIPDTVQQRTVGLRVPYFTAKLRAYHGGNSEFIWKARTVTQEALSAYLEDLGVTHPVIELG